MGDDGYVAKGDSGYGFNEMEGKDSFGDSVKGYEAFWAQLSDRDKQVYREPAEHKRKRLEFEKNKAAKPQGTSAGPVNPVVTEETQELLDNQQSDRETDTRNRFLQEEERMKTELSETPQADDNFESNLKVTPVGGKGYNAPVEQKRQSFDAAAEYLTALGHPFPQAAAAQAALESDWGASGLARDNNNFFGMKPGSKNSTQKALRDAGVEFEVKRYATEEVVDAKTLERFKKKYGDGLTIIKEEGSGKTRVKIPGEPFLTFPTPEEGFKGYMAWINHNMGDSLNVSTPKEYLQFLKTKGYATDDNYVEHIIGRAKSAGREI